MLITMVNDSGNPLDLLPSVLRGYVRHVEVVGSRIKVQYWVVPHMSQCAGEHNDPCMPCITTILHTSMSRDVSRVLCCFA